MGEGDFDDGSLVDFVTSLENLDVPPPPAVERVAGRVRRRRRVRRTAASVGVAGVGLLAVLAWPSSDGGVEQVGFADAPSSSTIDEAPPIDHPNAPVGEWVWHDNSEMVSRDGSPTGYGTRAGEVDDALIIYFENGHICADASTCSRARRSYTADTFQEDFLDDQRYRSGLFELDAPANPFAHWSAVFVPHSTGDLHAGVNPAADVPGSAGPHAMVGARNTDAMLAELVAAETSPGRVIVTGTGAGGMGALLNYERVVEAFPSASVDLLVDSAVVPLSLDLMPDCLVSELARGWQRSYPDDWPAAISGRYDVRLAGVYEYLSTKYPNAVFGLLSSSGDIEVRTVLGRGTGDCTGTEPIDAVDYEAGLSDLATHLEQFDNWYAFVIDGTEHGFLTGGNPDIDTAAETDGLRRWLDAFRPEESS